MVSYIRISENETRVSLDQNSTSFDIKKKIASQLHVPIQCINIFAKQDLKTENEILKDDLNVIALLDLAGGDEVFVREITGRVVTIQISLTSTVYQLKECIKNKIGLAPNKQTLFFQGKLLPDDKVLQEVDIRSETTISLVPKIE